jgi:Flp pilus assembly pilin Flp
MLLKIIKDQRGAILVEYALLATLIAVACVTAVIVIGGRVIGLFSGVNF